MGKFNRILQPGLAVLIPFLDRIAYVKSLKEEAMEIPSQSAITADNVTLELDGVLYTRIYDAYKARYGVNFLLDLKPPVKVCLRGPEFADHKTATVSRMRHMQSPNSHKLRCDPKLVS